MGRRLSGTRKWFEAWRSGSAGPISFVWALAAFSLLFDNVDESLPMFIELSHADPR
ncbi:MAG: hypothetical protein VYE01_09010 [Pseudomonadota bacterium]|nr:hypothetical protein [Pseudomonadota bacterium]